MLTKHFSTLKETINGDRAFESVKFVSNYHRIQASPGYRAAAEWCNTRLNSYGIDSKIISFPADGKTDYLTQRMFKEWDCKVSYLDLVHADGGRTRLCDYDIEAHSILQRSVSTDFSKTPVEMVVMDRGTSPEAYSDIDLKGKVLLIGEDHNAFMPWTMEAGAVALLSDRIAASPGVRDRGDLYEIIMYQSFWYSHQPGEVMGKGFAITPRQGDMLRELAKKGPVMLEGKIEADIYEGAIEVVEATIKGETDEEILITAHLCHPKTSANDNASGVAASIEAMHSIDMLIKSGRIPPLKRTLRMILIPEFSGTYPYLAVRENELHKIKAGINLDMVGGVIDDVAGPVGLTEVPHAAPAFIDNLSACVIELASQESNGRGGSVHGFNVKQIDYSGGSDHYILSDPTIGIPAPMIGQWPDKLYHTSGDDLSRVDPQQLGRSALLAAAYSYTACNMELTDVELMFIKAKERLASRVAKLTNSALHGNEEFLVNRLRHFCDIAVKGLHDTKRMFTGAELEKVSAMVDSTAEYMNEYTKWYINSLGEMKSLEKNPVSAFDGMDMVYKRTYKSPARIDRMVLQHDEAVQKQYKAMFAGGPMAMRAIKGLDTFPMWVDGKRTMGEIAYNMAMENGSVNTDAIVKMADLLCAMGLFVPVSGTKQSNENTEGEKSKA